MSVATPTTNGHREVGKPRLKRSMGLWMATALVVGNMVGSGIFTLPAVLAGEAGPGLDPGARLHRHRRDAARARLRQPRPRAPAHRRAVLLRPARVRRLRRLPDGLGLLDRRLGRQRRDRRRVRRLPRRLLGRRATRPTGWRRSSPIGAIWLFTLVNILGARETGSRPGLTTVLKFVPLAVIGIVGLFYIKGGNFTPFTPAQAASTGTSTRRRRSRSGRSSGSSRRRCRPRRSRTRRRRFRGRRSSARSRRRCSTSSRWSRSSASCRRPRSPARRRRSPTRRTRSGAERSSGLSWGKWIALVAMAATLGALNGWIMLTARVSLAAADDGLFPKPFARVHGERRTPVFGLRRLVRAGQRTRALQLERQLRGPLHGRRPAGDVDDADRLRLRGGGRARPLLPRAGAVHAG